MAWVGITPLAIGFFSLITGHSVIEHRWWYFAQILMSIPLAVAIYTVGTWKTKNLKSLYCLVFGFTVVLSFLMIMSPAANIDNHMFSPTTGSTYAYTQSEMVASEFFAKNTVGVISSDANYCTNPSSSVFIHAYGINQGHLLCLDDSLISGKFNYDGSVKIVRSIWFHEPMIKGGLSLPVRPDLNNYLSNLGFNSIYVNPTTSGFIG